MSLKSLLREEAENKVRRISTIRVGSSCNRENSISCSYLDFISEKQRLTIQSEARCRIPSEMDPVRIRPPVVTPVLLLHCGRHLCQCQEVRRRESALDEHRAFNRLRAAARVVWLVWFVPHHRWHHRCVFDLFKINIRGKMREEFFCIKLSQPMQSGLLMRGFHCCCFFLKRPHSWTLVIQRFALLCIIIN